MFSKLRYILFDFSDNFKNDFLSVFKSSIAFLIIGMIAKAFTNKFEYADIIAIICLLVFGFMWGKNLTTALVNFSNITSNAVLKWTIMLIMFAIGTLFGYIYFAWCLVKMIIVLIKKLAGK